MKTGKCKQLLLVLLAMTALAALAEEPEGTPAVLLSDEILPGDPNADEGNLRYGPPVDLKEWAQAPGIPMPMRTEGANDEVAPLGRMVTRDLRTGETFYSDGGPSEFLEGRALFHAGTAHEMSDAWSKDFNAYQLVPDPTLLEYRDKVKLYMKWINSAGDTLGYVGSGTLIGPSTVITAGHCVFNSVPAGSIGVNTIWAHEIKVVPAFGNSTYPYGSAMSVQLHAWEGWTDGEDWDHDIGIIDLDRPVGGLTGWEGYGVDGSCGFFTGGDWRHSDYPAEDGYDGQDMYTETGNYDGCESFGNEVWYDRPGHGGSSGGGAIRNNGEGNSGVWAIRSNTAWSVTTGWDSWDTRLTSTKFSHITEYILEDEAPAVDFVPLNFVLSDTVATIGGNFSPSSFRIFNNSATPYDGVVDFDLYLSHDNNISSADIRIASYQVDLYGVAVNWLAELVSLAGPAVPDTLLPGNYFVGVIVTTPDWNALNNETDGWDAAHIVLHCEPTSMTSLVSPADDSICLDPSSVTFSWNYVSTAVGYELSLTETNTPAAIYQASTNSITIPNLTPGENFWWTVRSVGACGDMSNYTGVWSISTVGATPAVPAMQSPADADSCISSEIVYFNWDPVEGANGYQLRVGTSCGSGSVYYESVTQTGITGLIGGTTYFWTVRATDECSQWSDWSPCRSFYTTPGLGGISGLRTPFYNQGEMSIPVLLEWEDTPEAASYEVRVGLDPVLGTVTSTPVSELLVSNLDSDTTYYWEIRPVSPCGGYGSWSPTWIFHTIGSGPNLTFATTPGWAAPVVARTANDASSSSVPAPVELVGDSLRTYWNFDGINDGDLGTGGFQNHLRVDGEYTAPLIMLSTIAGQWFPMVNRGPVTVRGGKHTFEVYLDANDNIAEQHEGDNGFAKQWTWAPSTISSATPVVRQAPPDMIGGHASIPWTEIMWANCDGVRINTTGWWNAAVVHATDSIVDYDVGLHNPTPDPTYGFEYFQAVSMRPIGCTDAVLVNRNVAGAVEEWDTGVFRQSGTGDYQIVHTISSGFAFGSAGMLPMAQDEMLLLNEVYIAPGDTGWISVIVGVDPADGPVYLNWLDKTFHKGGLLNYTATGVTDSTGHLALSLNIPASGYYCAVLYRDAADGTGPVDLALHVGPALPDLAVVTPANWHAPIVPRAAYDVAYPFDTVSAPSYLVGDTAGTHYYANVFNNSPAEMPAFQLSVQLDGDYDILYGYPSLPAFGTWQFHGGSLLWARGGLHTLALILDPQNTLFESHENNNSSGEQWGWLPVEHAVNSPGSRGAPPNKTGGWGTIPAGTTLWPNSDGIRTPPFSPLESHKWIAGTAILPLNAGTDYDLTLHPKDDGAATSFRTSHATSNWGASQSDFVVASMRNASAYQWDVGVTKVSGGGTYLYHSTHGPNLGYDPMGDHGPWLIGPNEILNLYEAHLSAGVYLVTAHNDSGNVDWGLSIIDQNIHYADKSETYQDGSSTGISWMNGPGLDEWVEFEVFQAGYYGLAVWKVGSADALKGGKYTLQLVNQAVDVGGAGEEMIPAVSDISSIRPNPFNPATTISFDLASDGAVDVSLFDLRGRHIRSLLADHRAAGSYQVVWDGMTDSGQPAASGLYFVRLKTGETIHTKKIALIR